MILQFKFKLGLIAETKTLPFYKLLNIFPISKLILLAIIDMEY